ncbi:unnamed protein product (macronuclear) [Paramecium tetraurelia]|uniref:G domain-containing protein n=1 Tax=Paramecium tetraurelia TaxID=5888 RepID=A0DNB1_PARTE|nr:uncharacterized protein GSPATT00039685001 [Paramecium tetraurelia]CAK84528.1 unnamed protein product [Paramecium tetraurelia]|eukprot:XP_001451925.1 hypothetical protein (macronuclear) [Paramecium tetraurelia strain d4-2]
MSIILLGNIGTGKTTLYNKITSSQEKTYLGGTADTKSVFIKNSRFGSGFLVLDTPGFGNSENKLDHIAGVLSALSEGPINRIFILLRFQRTDWIKSNVKTILPAFMNYINMITVIITFWDYCEENKEAYNKKEIQQMLTQLQINSVMFVGRKDTPESMCQQIDQIISKSKAQNVNLTENEIFQNFDMTDQDEMEFFEIQHIVEEFQSYYIEFARNMQQLINQKSISKELQTDFIYSITQLAKQMLEQTMNTFEKRILKLIDNQSEVNQLKSFKIHSELKNRLFERYQQIVDQVHRKYYKGKHFSNYIKKCYYCGQIWFQVTGCEGQTVCGRLNENPQDEFIQQEAAPQQYIITYEKGSLEYKPNESVKPKAVVLNERNKRNLMSNPSYIQKMTLGDETFNVGIGCRRVIDWGKMLPLSKQEMDELLSYLDDKLRDEMIEAEKRITQKKKMVYKNQLEMKKIEQKQKTKRA